MKKQLILLSFFLLSVSAYAQTSDKFNYEYNSETTRYWISPKYEKSVSKDARAVMGRLRDGQWFHNAYDSIIRKSISSDKLQQFKERGSGRFFMTYSITGKVLKVRLGISKKDLRILNEDDLSALFDNLYEFDMDMSKIEIEYPPNWIQGIEGYWTIVFPLKIW